MDRDKHGGQTNTSIVDEPPGECGALERRIAIGLGILVALCLLLAAFVWWQLLA